MRKYVHSINEQQGLDASGSERRKPRLSAAARRQAAEAVSHIRRDIEQFRPSLKPAVARLEKHLAVRVAPLPVVPGPPHIYHVTCCSQGMQDVILECTDREARLLDAVAKLVHERQRASDAEVVAPLVKAMNGSR